MAGLVEMNYAEAKPILLRPRRNAPGSAPEKGATTKPDWLDMRDYNEFFIASDRAFAAVMLVRLGDRQSLPAIRSFAKTANEDDKRFLEKAIADLEKLK